MRQISHSAAVLLCLLPLDLASQAVIETVAGGSSALQFDPLAVPLNDPIGVAMDRGEGLYFVSGGMVLRLDFITGKLLRTAGNGSTGFSGDGGLAVDANLDGPGGLAVDKNGNLYIADTDNHRIRKVDTAGSITTIAGDGTSGFAGDDGPALEAKLSWPKGLALDDAGNLFIADSRNGRIRKVDPSGIISTVAGRDGSGFGGDGGPAVGASLDDPSGLAVDANGNLYIADTDNHRIRKVGADGVITTVAGGGNRGFSGDAGPATNAGLNEPRGITVDPSGNLFIADTGNDRIRKVGVDGVITTVAGGDDSGFAGDGGPALEARLAHPEAITTDLAGNLFVAEPDNERIRRIDSGGVITTVAGGGPEGRATHAPGFAGDGGPSVDALLGEVVGLGLGPDQSVFLADRSNSRVRRIDSSGVIATVAGDGRIVHDDGGAGDGGPALAASLSANAVLADGLGTLFIGDSYSGRVRKVDAAGIIGTFAGDRSASPTSLGLASPTDLAIHPTGNLVVATIGGVVTIDPTGKVTDLAAYGRRGFSGDGGPAVTASMNWPTGVAVDAAGVVYIADMGNHRIRRVDRAGIITTIAGNGAGGPDGAFAGDGGAAVSASLSLPRDVAVDSDGNLYIADAGNSRIRKVDRDGIITTVAGNGVAGFSGDGGPPDRASLNQPASVVTIPGGLVIADTNNRRVRRIRF